VLIGMSEVYVLLVPDISVQHLRLSRLSHATSLLPESSFEWTSTYFLCAFIWTLHLRGLYAFTADTRVVWKFYVFRVSKCWTLAREGMRIMETEIRLFRAAAEYRMADHKRNEDVRE
jgi:hypothetical protein